MDIRSAEFVISNTDITLCPKPTIPEYAFIGRSNVGKSSLINAITHRKDLAKTSGRPGKTQLINHFLINDLWYLVDLPGYGYAQVSKGKRKEFQAFIRQYLDERPNLICVFVLIDVRHTPQKVDQAFMAWLGEKGIPFSIVFTKGDKLTKPARVKQVEAYQEIMLESWVQLPPTFITSSETKMGCPEILDFIDKYNKEYKH
jgi:GTP-binding protein